jgi:Fe-S-cluster containining protein
LLTVEGLVLTQDDCMRCGACCAYSPDWAELITPADHGPEGPDPDWVEDGCVRWGDGRCAALSGTIGTRTRCVIYARRPSPCRGCAPGSLACIDARRRHGLPIPAEKSSLDALLE